MRLGGRLAGLRARAAVLVLQHQDYLPLAAKSAAGGVGRGGGLSGVPLLGGSQELASDLCIIAVLDARGDGGRLGGNRGGDVGLDDVVDQHDARPRIQRLNVVGGGVEQREVRPVILVGGRQVECFGNGGLLPSDGDFPPGVDGGGHQHQRSDAAVGRIAPKMQRLGPIAGGVQEHLVQGHGHPVAINAKLVAGIPQCPIERGCVGGIGELNVLGQPLIQRSLAGHCVTCSLSSQGCRLGW